MSFSFNNNHQCQQHLIGLSDGLDSLDDEDPNIKPYDLGHITPFETRLVQALRDHPDRVEYWLKKGRMDKNHKFLLELYSKFFQVLAENNITYWLEFGSLLGYIRHHGIFPWEYDMDIAIESTEFPKLEALAAKLEVEGSEWGFEWHNYEDWEGAPDYVFYKKSHPGTYCDVTLYNRDGNVLKCYRPEWNYENYFCDQIFPLRKVVIFGQPAYIPNDPIKVLNYHEKLLGQITVGSVTNVNKVRWMQYDPIPFLLCQLYNPKHTQTLVTYALKSVPKLSTLLNKLTTTTVTQTESSENSENSDNGEEIKSSQDTSTTNNNDHNKKKKTTTTITKTLSNNPNEADETLFNSTNPYLLDIENTKTPLHIQSKVNSTVTFSDKEKSTFVDQKSQPQFSQFASLEHPAYFTSLEGETTMTLCPPEYSQDIANVCTDPKQNFIHELLYYKEHLLWGKMYQVLLGPGDSVFVPQGYLVQRSQFGQNSLQIKQF